jgi:hypothetical protein
MGHFQCWLFVGLVCMDTALNGYSWRMLIQALSVSLSRIKETVPSTSSCSKTEDVAIEKVNSYHSKRSYVQYRIRTGTVQNASLFLPLVLVIVNGSFSMPYAKIMTGYNALQSTCAPIISKYEVAIPSSEDDITFFSLLKLVAVFYYSAMANNQLNLNHSPEHVPLQLFQASNDPMNAHELPVSGKSQLGIDFLPSGYSVICGRGKGSYNHAGNHRFRELAGKSLKRYSRAQSTAERSAVFAEMVDMIHQAGGIFCTYEKGSWFEVGDQCAREKASALLRDMRFKCRSSAKGKSVGRKTKKQDKPLPQTQQYSQQPQTQQYSQQPVGGTGHSDDTKQTKQCVQHLIDGTGHWDDSLMLSWPWCKKDLLEFENSLEDEDDFSDVFKIDPLLGNRFLSSTPSIPFMY